MTESATPPFGVPLDPIQLRVLGSLIEKEITTPEQYPLSLNALVNACNQRSSRDPVVDLSERDVFGALQSLEDMGLVSAMRDARVAKYEHRARTVLNLRRDETALICLLLLRGPQTPGELRSRADRLYSFDDLTAVQTTLERLASRSPALDPAAPPARTTALTIQLPRQPGARESRYAHLLGEAPSMAVTAAVSTSSPGSPSRLDLLEAEIHALRERVDELAALVAQLPPRSGPDS
ncbi:hypothetical protein SAMN05421771_1048 [Granulicella pectinivorans]|uniref:Uncharacterized protein n=1 Tax=Granulicella pectinivorans TaxID=474950 RepID=A0A1I6LNW6_9BACT|nr:YceH family protein [Granulicella pectinivorans]SFS05186.1 hypothetical protein SAMN05421771_1048 [Granulicella pectinivorans]